MHTKAIVFTILGAIAGTLQACVEADVHKTVRSDAIVVSENQRIAGVGDAVLSIQNSESLPNALGGADIFGRTRPTGTTTLYYAGTSAGKATFIRRDVLIQSSKTTMNSTPVVINRNSRSHFSGQVGGIPYTGVASTRAYPIVLPPNTPQDRVIGVRDLRIPVSIGKTLVVSGKTLKVITASANQVTFEIH